MKQLVIENPRLRPTVIDGLILAGETLNVISHSKGHKSFLVGDLALAMAAGRPWLDTFATRRGDVLILDNELHKETIAFRIPNIAQARGMTPDQWEEHITVDSLRGRNIDLIGLPNYLAGIPRGQYQLLILDSLYKFWPAGVSENDNNAINHCYSQIDRIAAMLDCSVVVIHHTSKGSQVGKTTTEIGAGAGSIARAADSHMTLVPHATDTPTAPTAILKLVARNFLTPPPRCLRFRFPVWELATDLDPNDDRARKPRPKTITAPAMTPTEFVNKFIGNHERTAAELVSGAGTAGMPASTAKRLLSIAETSGLITSYEAAGRRFRVYTAKQQ
ncbi:MAG: AAA family ATPase [Chloroflexi bacterium]|nr:AAA family ATPase [Chloroflexota bacterium]